jgi:hypothetical protein
MLDIYAKAALLLPRQEATMMAYYIYCRDWPDSIHQEPGLARQSKTARLESSTSGYSQTGLFMLD